jgi:hypothetical protein
MALRAALVDIGRALRTPHAPRSENTPVVDRGKQAAQRAAPASAKRCDRHPRLSPSGTTGGVSSCSTCSPTAARTAASNRGSDTGSPSTRGQSSRSSTSVVISGSSTVAPTPWVRSSCDGRSSPTWSRYFIERCPVVAERRPIAHGMQNPLPDPGAPREGGTAAPEASDRRPRKGTVRLRSCRSRSGTSRRT